MTEQSLRRDYHSQAPSDPGFVDDVPDITRMNEAQLSHWATLDRPLVLIVALLLVIGSGMVFSTTFNWSLDLFGSSTTIFVQRHMRNVVLALAAGTVLSLVDYRFWRRFTPLLFLFTLGALLAVNLFGDVVFNARRALVGGSLQPGELAEFTVVLYMASWLGAKRTRVSSFVFGLIPFLMLLTIVAIPILLQPDISTLVIIILTAGAMYFLAGARIWHLIVLAVIVLVLGFAVVEVQPTAQNRWASYVASLSDPTKANYHTQQVITAFVTGGWFGKGIGQSTQKFNNAIPAPHTDSIFAVIGEELGVIGASLVVLLFVVFVMRGFNIARRAVDPFGSLLAIGITLQVAVQALLNIAVMTAVVPTSGLPLPFISFGGSSLTVTVAGVGLLLSISRVATMREQTTKRRHDGATADWGWGNRRARLSRSGGGRSTAQIRRRRA